MNELDIKARELSRRTRVDRETIARALRGESTATSLAALESYLDKFEAMIKGEPVVHATDAGDDYVEFVVEGNFGVRAVVKGPVRDMDELQRAVGKLVRDMRGDDRADEDA